MSPRPQSAAPASQGTPRSKVMAALGAAVALALLGGCATGPDATWSDPQLGARPLQGARVMVVCESVDTTLQQVCMDRMAEEVTARGLTPVRATQTLSGRVGQGAEAYLGAARAAGATALLLTSVTPDNTRAYQPSPFSLGIGGFSFGGHSGAGVGVSVPIGGGGMASSPGYAANGSFSDTGSGRLLWSGRTSTTTTDFNAGMQTMSRTLLEAAEKAGVF